MVENKQAIIHSVFIFDWNAAFESNFLHTFLLLIRDRSNSWKMFNIKQKETVGYLLKVIIHLEWFSEKNFESFKWAWSFIKLVEREENRFNHMTTQSNVALDPRISVENGSSFLKIKPIRTETKPFPTLVVSHRK